MSGSHTFIEQVKDILMEHTASPRSQGLTCGCIAYFIEKQHFQVPSTTKIGDIVQGLIDEGEVYVFSEGHYKWL